MLWEHEPQARSVSTAFSSVNSFENKPTGPHEVDFVIENKRG